MVQDIILLLVELLSALVPFSGSVSVRATRGRAHVAPAEAVAAVVPVPLETGEVASGRDAAAVSLEEPRVVLRVADERVRGARGRCARVAPAEAIAAVGPVPLETREVASARYLSLAHASETAPREVWAFSS